MARAGERLVALGAMAACAMAAAGCGSQPARQGRDAAVLRVSEKDFKISAPATVRAGDVRLVVSNHGPDDHELVVVRAPIVGELPMRRDGLTVDEDAIEHATAGAVEPEPSGTVSKLDIHLKPGRYVLLCNMSGHYLGGMDRTVVVL
jgi:uncharacterized cupredoxin-like copper-binding protein